VEAAAHNAIPGWVILPEYRAGHDLQLCPMPKADTFMQLVESAFNYSVHGRRGFDALTEFVKSSRCYQFTYGGGLEDAVGSIERLVEEA
jgi:hypothetical protein